MSLDCPLFIHCHFGFLHILEQYYFELILLNVVYKLHIKPTWQSRMEYRETQVRLGQDTDRRYTKRNIQHRNPPNKRGGGG